MAKHEAWELKQMQSLPLSAKIRMTEYRIRQWIEEFGEDGVYVSFSGGKDSTALLDIVRKNYPNVKAVFFDTGLEYPEIREFVKGYDNVEWIRPKMNFREVITKYGYPFISKEVSDCVQGARKYLTSILQNETVLTDRQTDSIVTAITLINSQDKVDIQKEIIPSADNESLKKMSRGGYDNQYRKLRGIGEFTKRENDTMSMFSQEKYKFFLNAPFEISKKCCNVMKKNPSHTYMRETGRKPITAQMASESRLRLQTWIKNGCNAFDGKNPISNPMSFWTVQDIYLYIRENNLPIASVYGDIVVKNNGLQGQLSIYEYLDDYRECEFSTTGCNRTGCMFCGFGCHLEKAGEGRFERMAITHPKQLDYVMRGGAFAEDGLWKPSNEGLGYWLVMKWINVHGNLNMAIPNYEHYEEEYGNEMTHYYLYEI